MFPTKAQRTQSHEAGYQIFLCVLCVSVGNSKKTFEGN